ncbi:MAG TPA: hypothetical protein VGD72_01420, partial [Mycobacteriales bacterium]
DTVRYAAYLAWGVVLPGTLVHRALRGRRVRLSEDLAAGVVVGMALELAVFVVLVATGLQVLLPWWPLLVVVPMLAVPRLRRNWRWGGEPGWTTGQAWALAAIVAAVVLWVAQAEWIRYPVRASATWWPRSDELYHLAIAGEVRNHIPPTASWVLGQPLDYHWFHNAQLAASSTVTGIELRVLLLRFCLLALIPATVLLTAAAAARLSGRAWAGPVAAALALVVADVNPYLWANALFAEGGLLGTTLWYSPSQLYATTVLALTVLLLVDLLRDGSRRAGTWVLLALTVVVLAGAKSTFLPLLGAGLGLAFVVQLLRRRLDRVLLAAGVLVLGTFAAAFVVLFGGQAQGLAVDPLQTVVRSLPGRAVAAGTTTPSLLLVVVLTAVALLSWGGRLVAAAVVLRRRWDDPMVGVLAGVTVAGVAGTLLTFQPGASQYYFIRGAMPLGAILAAWGLAIGFDRLGLPVRRAAVFAVGAATLGVAAAAFAANATGAGHAMPRGVHGRTLLLHLLLPIPLALVACVVAALFGLFPGVRVPGARVPGARARRHAAVLAVLVAVSAVGLWRLGVDGLSGVRFARAHGTVDGTRASSGYPVTPAGLAAAHWLRDHSSPDDVVATNLHCRVVIGKNCDNRQWWLAAFAERRVLVEGWGYTSRGNAEYLAHPTATRIYFEPFWDLPRLRANDAAFTDPTPERLAELRDRWGVRWLFVHTHAGVRPNPDLDRLADLRFANREARVYELR